MIKFIKASTLYEEADLRVPIDNLMENFKEYVKKPIPIKALQINEPFKVETLEGVMQGKPGDYLVIGIRGEMYPCDKGIFEDSYEEVI